MRTAHLTSAAAALASLHARDPASLERTFALLDATALSQLDRDLLAITKKTADSATSEAATAVTGPGKQAEVAHAAYRTIARALIRQVVHRTLDKHICSSSSGDSTNSDEVEAALRMHVLPGPLRRDLADKYGGDPPETWFDALARLREISANASELWGLVMDHPLTSYVPVQCQSCGHVVRDETRSGLSDADVGLTEVEPTEDERPFVRSGWFRGPRGPVVLSLHCPECGVTSRWYRSADPACQLNPNKWGRLCGEQEDLRLRLAEYLGIKVRTAIPLDWDHVWSEHLCDGGGEWDRLGGGYDRGSWHVHDGSARNFAVRLNEGIGAWTGILVVSAEPDLCGDVTDEYLSCQSEGGRADDEHAHGMARWRSIVEASRKNSTGEQTQARTVKGYAIFRAHMTGEEVTAEMRRAATDHGTSSWWQV